MFSGLLIPKPSLWALLHDDYIDSPPLPRSSTQPVSAWLPVLCPRLSSGEDGWPRSDPEARAGGPPETLPLQSDLQEEVSVGQTARTEGGGQTGSHAAEVGTEY